MIYHRLIVPFLIALQFMTTVPVRLPYLPSREQNALSMLFYPVIGLMIGAVLWLVVMLPLPMLLLSCVLMAVWVWLTGGLHLDGLADTADAWVGGYGDRERTLTIMKDPNTGAMGVIAIVLCLALKWASIYSLLELKSFLALFFVPMLGRVSVLVLFATTPYVRKQGLGSALQDMPKAVLWPLVAGFALLTMVLSWQVAMVMIGVWGLSAAYLRHLFIKRIGGITGDTVGASIEIVEVVLLLVLVALVNSPMAPMTPLAVG